MEVLYLGQKDVKGLGISMKEVLKAVDQGFYLKHPCRPVGTKDNEN
jgi:hypothetical protein